MLHEHSGDSNQEQPTHEEHHQQAQQQHQQHEGVVVHGGYSIGSVAATWCAGAIVGTLAGVLGFLFVATVAAGSMFPSKQPRGPPERDDGSVCYSPDCLAATAYLHDKLNPLVEPCRNFADYVCGRLRGPGSVMDQVFKYYVVRVEACAMIYNIGPGPPWWSIVVMALDC
ncbi:hypothetical protein HPB51_007923 [Rhipicephalus microplus]|uniref:Peptidase M13 N-terminal domain-containing protein n=1 Tax=Rhipicephalus microplus TaxID=6941 RepID=A0A9J6EN65_RHIMP|nr:hypothetical protein HPB51_007923 [Rhipicephalus microplus]